MERVRAMAEQEIAERAVALHTRVLDAITEAEAKIRTSLDDLQNGCAPCVLVCVYVFLRVCVHIYTYIHATVSVYVCMCRIMRMPIC